MAAALLARIVNNLDVVNGIRNNVRQSLVIRLRRKLVRAVAHLEAVIKACDKVNGTLALGIAVERGAGNAVDRCGVTQFLEERSLVINAGGKTQRHVMIERRYYAQRRPRTDDALLVEVPMAEPYAVIQREEGMPALAGKAPGILQISLHAVGVEPVAGVKRVNHVKVLPGMGYAVAARVAHFVLLAVLLDRLHLVRKSGQYVMFSGLVGKGQLHALYRSLEVIAGVLHVSAHTKVFACLGLRQPILPLYVVFFLLVGMECRCRKRYIGALAELTGYAQRTEIRAEQVFLASVKVNAEQLYVLHRTETRLAVFGEKVVMAFRHISHQLYFPPAVGLVRQVSLVVKEVGTVFSLGLKRAEQVSVGLVPQAVAPRKLLRTEANIRARAEQTGRRLCLKLLWFTVSNVENRRHLVAILCLKAAGREAYGLNHVGVDD